LATGATDGTVSLWEATTGKKVATFQGPLQQLSALAITRDGQSAASGTPQGAVKLWELNTG